MVSHPHYTDKYLFRIIDTFVFILLMSHVTTFNLLQFCNDVSGLTVTQGLHWTCTGPTQLMITRPLRHELALKHCQCTGYSHYPGPVPGLTMPCQPGNTWGKIFLYMMNISTLPLPIFFRLFFLHIFYKQQLMI